LNYIRHLKGVKEIEKSKGDRGIMKTTGICLMIASITGLVLSSCSSNSSIARQVTSLNVGCKFEDVQVLDESVELNGTETWTAKCDGKIYSCTYLPESSSDCYEISE